VTQPYRYSLLDYPCPYQPTLWHRIKRLHVRARLRFAGTFCERHPWPCPKCGRRGAAHLYEAFSGYYAQRMVVHICCSIFSLAHKTAQGYLPYSRQRQRRLNEEQVQRARITYENTVTGPRKKFDPIGNSYYEDNDWE
jgi:hypothetical protein